MRQVYLDHAATTPVHAEVASLMSDFIKNTFGNPSSLYSYGRDAKKLIEAARQQVADLIGADDPEEIYFTSGGTEADNIAIRGLAAARVKNGKHIITSAIEHPAVLNTCNWLAKNGYDVTFLPVDEYGMVKPDDVKKAIRPDTVLISVMHANNEIGTIQPIAEIAQIAKEHEVIMHTDAVQTVGKIPVNVKELGVDLLSLSGHKIYGPKGVGALYKKNKLRVHPIVFGGGQEKNLRSGTENTIGIVGLGKAMEIAGRDLAGEGARVQHMRDKLIKGLLEAIPESRLNGHPTNRLPHNANFSIAYVEGESMVMRMDMQGICCSSGSACSSHALHPSHVLVATGIPIEMVHGSLRMTLGRDNSEEDIDYVIETIPGIIKTLRSFSPLYNKITSS
jgi:cysteine desulfurase